MVGSSDGAGPRRWQSRPIDPRSDTRPPDTRPVETQPPDTRPPTRDRRHATRRHATGRHAPAGHATGRHPTGRDATSDGDDRRRRTNPRGAWWSLRRLVADEGGAVWSATVGPESLGDDALAALAVADPEAFGVLFRRHVTAVHAFVQRRCRSIDLADDLTAAAFEKAWRALPTLSQRRRWLPAVDLPDRRQRDGEPLPQRVPTGSARAARGAARVADRSRRRGDATRSIGGARGALATQRAQPRGDHVAVPRRPVDRRDSECARHHARTRRGPVASSARCAALGNREPRGGRARAQPSADDERPPDSDAAARSGDDR